MRAACKLQNEDRKEKIEELADAINREVERLSENTESYEEYLTSFCYGGESDPYFGEIENKVLSSYLEDCWKKNKKEVIEEIGNYCTIYKSPQMYASEANALYSYGLHSVDENVDMEYVLGHAEAKIYRSLDSKERDFLSKRLDCCLDDKTGTITYQLSGQLHLILDVEALVSDIQGLYVVERLTSPVDFVRNFPLKEILENED
jgi:hypothetical protein